MEDALYRKNASSAAGRVERRKEAAMIRRSGPEIPVRMPSGEEIRRAGDRAAVEIISAAAAELSRLARLPEADLVDPVPFTGTNVRGGHKKREKPLGLFATPSRVPAQNRAFLDEAAKQFSIFVSEIAQGHLAGIGHVLARPLRVLVHVHEPSQEGKERLVPFGGLKFLVSQGLRGATVMGAVVSYKGMNVRELDRHLMDAGLTVARSIISGSAPTAVTVLLALDSENREFISALEKAAAAEGIKGNLEFDF